MKYIGQESDIRNNNTKTGVLLVNLGTPERPVCPDLRKYLAEFLMDSRVLELPTLLRMLLVKGIIINVRSHKSAAKYRQIWAEQGSPLLFNSMNLGDKVATSLGDGFKVEVAMRYGKPSIAEKVRMLHGQGIRNLIVVPLYPQYSGSTNGSVFDSLGMALGKQRWIPHLRFVSDYYQHDSYIKAIGDSIQQHWQQHGRNQKLIMSFHGIPKKYVVRGDPYQLQCQETAECIAEYLKLDRDTWLLVFQSRFGAQEWLQPYCDQTLQQLPVQGTTSVDIVCPGFSVDCLETLEEINVENKAYFLEAGGENYSYIPCLNDSESHATLFADIIQGGA